MSLFAKSFGLVLEGDLVSLSPDTRVVGAHLVDSVTGARHSVHHGAQDILVLLTQWQRVEDWLAICRQHDISTSRALEMLGFINYFATFRRRRTPVNQVRSVWRSARLLTHGGRSAQLARRFPASWVGAVRATAHGMLRLLPAMSALLFVWFGAGILTMQLLAVAASALLVMGLTIVVHEMVHNHIALRAGVSTVFVQRGLRIGTLHQPLSAKLELRSALLGPLAGIASAGLCAGVAFIIHLQIFAVSFVVIGLFHACSWLPLYGDGVALLSNWKKRHA